MNEPRADEVTLYHPRYIVHERGGLEKARQQVEAVCANASLSAVQKREEIRQIRERERQ